jgi:glycosyltransferase involved in cell wall biosynthesis
MQIAESQAKHRLSCVEQNGERPMTLTLTRIPARSGEIDAAGLTTNARLLVVSDTLAPDPNGVALIALRTSELLGNRGPVHLFGPAGAHASERITYTGVGRSPIGTADFRLPRPSLRELSLAVRQSDRIVVHTLGPLGCAALVLARHHGRQSTLFLHNDFSRLVYHTVGSRLGRVTGGVAALVERWAVGVATRVIAPRSLGMRHCETLRLEPPLFRGDAPRLAAGGPIVVAYHGRVSPEKSVDSIVRAIAEADPTRTSFRFRLIGDGSQLSPTLRLARELDVAVEHIPWCDDPLASLAGTDIYVMASRTETYSMATLEAMGCGLPIIARGVGEIPGYVNHGVNGLLFDQDRQLPALIRQLAGDSGLRHRLAARALTSATPRSVWEQFADAASR